MYECEEKTINSWLILAELQKLIDSSNEHARTSNKKWKNVSSKSEWYCLDDLDILPELIQFIIYKHMSNVNIRVLSYDSTVVV